MYSGMRSVLYIERVCSQYIYIYIYIYIEREREREREYEHQAYSQNACEHAYNDWMYVLPLI
jgi:hypothetical protein